MSAIIIIPFLQIKKLNVQSHLLKDTELVGFKPEFIYFFLCSTISSVEKDYTLALMGQDIIEISCNYWYP